MTSDTYPAALSIAGSDPSGGAGIQADLKTFTAVGVYGCAAITCLTAQNTTGVASYQAVAPDFVAQQIKLVRDDLPISHIKTGMVGTGPIAEAIGNALRDFSGEFICDPVIKATDGHNLLKEEALEQFRQHVIARATVLTPNRNELETITGRPCSQTDEALQAAASLFTRFPNLRAAILTGGHLDTQANEVTDYLLLPTGRTTNPQIISASHPRIDTRNTHGTGCTFAAAFTAFHLLVKSYEAAFRKATVFMSQLLSQSAPFKFGHGHGPLFHHLYDRRTMEE